MDWTIKLEKSLKKNRKDYEGFDIEAHDKRVDDIILGTVLPSFLGFQRGCKEKFDILSRFSIGQREENEYEGRFSLETNFRGEASAELIVSFSFENQKDMWVECFSIQSGYIKPEYFRKEDKDRFSIEEDSSGIAFLSNYVKFFHKKNLHEFNKEILESVFIVFLKAYMNLRDHRLKKGGGR